MDGFKTSSTGCRSGGTRWPERPPHRVRFLHASSSCHRHGWIAATIAAVSDQPSGLGFMPAGRLLIVSDARPKGVVGNSPAPREHGRYVPALAPWHLNDLWIDGDGGRGRELGST